MNKSGVVFLTQKITNTMFMDKELNLTEYNSYVRYFYFFIPSIILKVNYS